MYECVCVYAMRAYVGVCLLFVEMRMWASARRAFYVRVRCACAMRAYVGVCLLIVIYIYIYKAHLHRKTHRLSEFGVQIGVKATKRTGGAACTSHS